MSPYPRRGGANFSIPQFLNFSIPSSPSPLPPRATINSGSQCHPGSNPSQPHQRQQKHRPTNPRRQSPQQPQRSPARLPIHHRGRPSQRPRVRPHPRRVPPRRPTRRSTRNRLRARAGPRLRAPPPPRTPRHRPLATIDPAADIRKLGTLLRYRSLRKLETLQDRRKQKLRTNEPN